MMKHNRPVSSPVLVIDLDHTLLCTDMLPETFWSACSHNSLHIIRSAGALIKGKAALKRYLADAATPDPATLPYNPAVIHYIRTWRDQGGRTALVTASDQKIAELIAHHINLFDEIHGSDGKINLKGEVKAQFLTHHFAATGFAYIGDSAADLPIWCQAQKAITVNASPALQKKVAALGVVTEHLHHQTQTVAAYFQALRPHQWAKNSLVFLPMLAAHQFTGETWLQSVWAFIAFSLIASQVYILNDLSDLAADRAHPRKRHRPLASGAVPLIHGMLLAAGLLCCSLVFASYLGTWFVSSLLIYYVITTAYSFLLKRYPIIDICVLSGLYTLRVVSGGIATGITLSAWLMMFSVFIFFALAALKRYTELVENQQSDQLVMNRRGYDTGDTALILPMVLSAGYVAILIIALYISSPDIMRLYATPEALWGVCATLLYWINYVVMMTHRGQMHDDPILFAIKNRTSHICFLLIIASFIIGAWV